MDTRRTPLLPGKIYHLYNRGVDSQNIFLEERNYAYFLEKYARYAHPFLETYAYCLLKNHFHILARVRDEESIRGFLNGKKARKSTSWHASNGLSSLFQSYAQAINNGYGRTGTLFEESFHRIEVDNSIYFSRMVWYIHHNPQKHGFVDNFREWPHSSYHAHLYKKNTKLERGSVLEWFGDTENYLQYHSFLHDEHEIKKYIIEFD